MISRLLVWAIVFACAAWSALTPPQQAQIMRIENALMAPCCWTQRVSLHSSEVSSQIKAEVTEMATAGKSDREILDYFIAKYGKRILVEPEGSASYWLHITPFAVLFFGGIWAALMIRKWRMRSQAAS